MTPNGCPGSFPQRAYCVLFVLTAAATVLAQDPDPTAPLSQLPRPVANAVKIDEAVVIDGRLDEGMWQSASPLGDFVQAEPFQGRPVSERTEVRILYDDRRSTLA